MSPRVVFVCWGNICRSPMGERVAKAVFAREGVHANVTSAGVSDEERGNPIDRRAQRALRARGYEASGHAAHRITADEIRDADLICAFEPVHRDRMLRAVPDATSIRLMTEFIPDATGDAIDDPWYGDQSDFEACLDAIEAAMPGIVAAVRSLP